MTFSFLPNFGFPTVLRCPWSRVLWMLLVMASPLPAQEPFQAGIVGEPSDHEVFWPTQSNYNYHVEISEDLNTWLTTDIKLPGTGLETGVFFSRTEDRLFYRIFETSFLLLPTPNQHLELIDGVRFALNLNFFAALPAKVTFHQRPSGSSGPWSLIGSVADFVHIDGIRTIRGSTVWLPSTGGAYQVKVEVRNAAGGLLGTEYRNIQVGPNQPPVISFVSGPASPASEASEVSFVMNIEDPDNVVRRVEFFDNGQLIGTDDLAPFGDYILDVISRRIDLLKGSHSITAKAYDTRGVVGTTSAPYLLNVTSGNSRPVVNVTSPVNAINVQAGQNFTINYTASDPDGNGSLTTIQVSGYGTVISPAATTGTLTINTDFQPPGSYLYQIFVKDASGAESYRRLLRVNIQAAVGTSFADTLAANLADESTAAPSNAAFLGFHDSTQAFTAGLASGLQMDEGIVMTTGLASVWNTGDNAAEEERTSTGTGWPGDDRLRDHLSGEHQTLDAAVLEFDVHCVNGQLELEHQFGSEEYDEFVGNYNDGFLVTIDGTPVSLVPDGLAVVSVNSVNATLNSHLYLDDDADISPTVSPANQPVQVEYDGMTIRLKCFAFVTPETTHRIRLVVANIIDSWWDSAVFLKKSSLRSIPPQP